MKRGPSKEHGPGKVEVCGRGGFVALEILESIVGRAGFVALAPCGRKFPRRLWKKFPRRSCEDEGGSISKVRGEIAVP
jgi:hypothetical protein